MSRDPILEIKDLKAAINTNEILKNFFIGRFEPILFH